jgi:hypothetical protein
VADRGREGERACVMALHTHTHTRTTHAHTQAHSPVVEVDVFAGLDSEQSSSENALSTHGRSETLVLFELLENLWCLCV